MEDLLGRCPIEIRLLGDFQLSLRRQTEPNPRFRSRTAERLLAALVLRLDSGIHKGDLADSLWPESDGDRQSQNLRKALSDVRQVLETDSRAATVVLSQGDRVWLDPDLVESDVRVFRRLTDAGLAEIEPTKNLRQAIELYRGALLSGADAPWLIVHRMELEERFAQAVHLLLSQLLQEEKYEEALRIGRKAVTVAPLREDVHMALVRSYASAGLHAEAMRQFEDLERLLDEQWGTAPSQKSVAEFDDLAQTPAPRLIKAVADGAKPTFETSGGAVSRTSSFYIVRQCDRELKKGIERSEGTILIHGPRQVGKTSLLGSVLSDAKAFGSRVVITDFQVLSKTQMESSEAFYRSIAHGFVTQLGSDVNLKEIWSDWIGPNSNLHVVVETVLRGCEQPVVWAMDEADRLFDAPFTDDFFGLIRSWHNLRSIDESGPFGNLTMVIAYATEAHLFIQDINQSPFNVGVRVDVSDFRVEETAELGLRYGLSLSASDVDEVWKLTGGQPFLTRKAFDGLANGGETIGNMKMGSAQDDGPFGDHLRRLLTVSTRDEDTRAEIVRFLKGQPFKDPKTPIRLVSGGLLAREGDGLRFRVPLYGVYLSKFLTG